MLIICYKFVVDDVFMMYVEDIIWWFYDKFFINLLVLFVLCLVLENLDGCWFFFLYYFLFFMDKGSRVFMCYYIGY